MLGCQLLGPRFNSGMWLGCCCGLFSVKGICSVVACWAANQRVPGSILATSQVTLGLMLGSFVMPCHNCTSPTWLLCWFPCLLVICVCERDVTQWAGKGCQADIRPSEWNFWVLVPSRAVYANSTLGAHHSFLKNSPWLERSLTSTLLYPGVSLDFILIGLTATQ